MTLLACLLAQADPAALVERLGSDDIEIRRMAEADLIRLGPAAEEALDAASKRADPELASRARALLSDAVAPHRREVDDTLRHVGFHLRKSVIQGDGRTLEHLYRIEAIDPSHRFSLSPEWNGGFETLVRKLDADGVLRGLNYPSAAAWAKIRGSVDSLSYDPGCFRCVERQLRTFKLGFSFENVKAIDVIAYLKEVGNIHLVVDAMVTDEARDVDLDRAMTVEAKDLTLGEALGRVLGSCGLEAMVLAEEGVVLARRKPR